jgi:peroxiredoxin Q/BCP
MRRTRWTRSARRSVLVGLSVLGCLVAGIAVAAPSVGDRAPDFSLTSADGETVALSQFVGKRGVVLAWFPRAFTPG